MFRWLVFFFASKFGGFTAEKDIWWMAKRLYGQGGAKSSLTVRTVLADLRCSVYALDLAGLRYMWRGVMGFYLREALPAKKVFNFV